ncbi:MAG: YcaO-like family protein [Rhizobiales bacterium]|nr:YcaO-like family protein [Hyphomicrobiales bacterium]
MPHDGTALSNVIERLHHIEVGNGCPFHIAAAVLKPDAWGRRRVVSGRGLSADEAARNCLFEAEERQGAVFSGDHPTLRGSARNLEDEAVNPSRLLQISAAQYLSRHDWNAAVPADHALPGPFDEQADVTWVVASSLLTGRRTLVPAACCWLGFPRALEEGFPVPDSSGLAAGPDRDDAIARAVAECVERDAVSIWWYNRVARPSAALTARDLAVWQPFSAWVRRCGRRWWLLDLTHDLALPVVAAVSCDEQGSALSLGFGCAPDLATAATQAMGELVQFEMTRRTLRIEGEGAYPHLVSWCSTTRLRDNEFLSPSDGAPRMQARGWTAVDALRHAGLEAHVVDCPGRRNDVKIVRVLVPGLRSIWPRLAPGRLYDVPVALGWREKPLAETELNPVPMLY